MWRVWSEAGIESDIKKILLPTQHVTFTTRCSAEFSFYSGALPMHQARKTWKSQPQQIRTRHVMESANVQWHQRSYHWEPAMLFRFQSQQIKATVQTNMFSESRFGFIDWSALAPLSAMPNEPQWEVGRLMQARGSGWTSQVGARERIWECWGHLPPLAGTSEWGIRWRETGQGSRVRVHATSSPTHRCQRMGE